MTVTLIPDATKITAKYLREHADLQAFIGRRVVVDTPRDTSEPWVRYTQIDTQNTRGSRVEHLLMYLVQFDCYAGQSGGWPEARLVARTVRAIVHDQLPGALGLGALITMTEIIGDHDMLDAAFKPDRERVIITGQVWAHA